MQLRNKFFVAVYFFRSSSLFIAENFLTKGKFPSEVTR